MPYLENMKNFQTPDHYAESITKVELFEADLVEMLRACAVQAQRLFEQCPRTEGTSAAEHMSQVILDFWKWQIVVQGSSDLLSTKEYVKACNKSDPEVLKAQRMVRKEAFASIDPASELKIINASKDKDEFKSFVGDHLLNYEYYQFYADVETEEAGGDK